MTTETELGKLTLQLAADIKLLKASIGPLASLTTTEKTNLVLAINELKAGSGGSSGPVDPPGSGVDSTANYTYTNMAQGFMGSVNLTSNAARAYIQAGTSLWAGFIVGTEAKLTLTSDYGDFDGAVEVAIDGGAFGPAARSGSVFTLFTGLPHATHLVEWRVNSGLGSVAYVARTGNILTVIGQPPALQVLPNRVQVEANSSTGLYNGTTMANTTDFVPLLTAPKGEIYGSNVNCVKIKGQFTKMLVTLNSSRVVSISKNGEAPVVYTATDETDNPARAIKITLSGVDATYYIWDDGNYRNLGGAFTVSVDATLLDIGVVRRFIQIGDSLTFGAGSFSSQVETMWVAARMEMAGSTNGISGLTIAAAKTLIDNVVANRVIGATDVFLLAIGGNNAETGVGTPEKADYDLCIDKLLAKNPGTIICRGLLPSPNAGSQALIAAANAQLKSVVDAKANAKVIWCDPVTWTDYTTADGVHPDAPGYVDIADYAVPAYKTLLGIA